MKRRSLSSVLVALPMIFPSLGLGQLLHDDFSSGSIDTTIWQPVAPFYDSSISSAGGYATFVNRGQLLTSGTYGTSLDISGRFSFAGSTYDNFRIVTRTDGISTNPWYEMDRGIHFTFSLRNGDWNDQPGNIGIAVGQYPNATIILGYTTFSLVPNASYDFRIVDTGNAVSLFITDLNTPIITASTTSNFGGRIALYNREGSGGGSSISAGSTVRLDYITVVPEPSTYALLLLSGAAWLGALKRRRSHVRPSASGQRAGMLSTRDNHSSGVSLRGYEA